MQLRETIETGWDKREELSPSTPGMVEEAVRGVLQSLDEGTLRVAEKKDDTWVVNSWVKKAILLSFRLYPNEFYRDPLWSYDKFPLKFENWEGEDYEQAQIRALPGSIVRYSAYVGPSTILMPSFINLGAYVGEGSMIDTWATVGSCAQIGKNCHISGGAGIGGVLEPLQANPVIIEDDCFIGARSEVVEGMIVKTGAVIGMGVFLSPSTPIVNRDTGETVYGVVPPYSVVIPGTLPGKPLADGTPGPNLSCGVIVKTVDAQTRGKTSLNELLRP